MILFPGSKNNRKRLKKETLIIFIVYVFVKLVLYVAISCSFLKKLSFDRYVSFDISPFITLYMFPIRLPNPKSPSFLFIYFTHPSIAYDFLL